MLKEVGASGQISLDKKYAGQLFDLQSLADGSLVMRPVKVVPATVATPEEPKRQATIEWAQQHAEQSAHYNEWAAQREPYSQRVRRWRSSGL
jgi:hypothetical protein